jgi:NTE family protein
MKTKKIAVALQGGGSHGAFSWGVLEALLSEGSLEVEGFSGTSAGGMNAAAAVQGLIAGGSAGAIASLEDYWRQVCSLARHVAPWHCDPWGDIRGDHNLRTAPATLLSIFFKPFLSELSPYDINPFNFNPFRNFVERFFDFEKIQRETRWKLFLSATNVETGKIKIFKNPEVHVDSLMATTCLPTLFQAVEIDGHHYWDGGYIANPAIFPLINDCTAKDILVVQLTKGRPSKVPMRSEEITDRFNEITLNSCLIREIRAIYLITRLIDEGKISDPAMRRINLHIIKDNEFFSDLSAASKMNTGWPFMSKLRRAGFRAGQRWIEEHFDSLGDNLPFPQHVLDDYI